MDQYKLSCSRGYAILNEAPPKIDQSVLYWVISKSQYFPDCVVVERIDRQKFLGNDKWIVPESALILVEA